MMENREIQERPTTIAEKLKKRATSSNLTKHDIFEELDIILIDVSGSMCGLCKNGMQKLTAVKKSIPYLWARSAYIGYGLVAFSDDAFIAQPITPSFNYIHLQVDNLQPISGTNIGAGMFAGLQMIDNQLGEKKRMILLSDGQDSHGKRDIMQAVMECKQKDVVVDCIAFGDDADENLLREISKQTGGKFTKVNSPQELETTYKELNYEIRYLENKRR